MDAFFGEIRIFAGNYAPVNWHFCDGSTLAISQYEALFTLIGTTYGGDGISNFGIPDLRGRIPLHTGQGPGLTSRPMASMAGTETVTLLTANLPAHTHAMMASTGNATSNSPVAAVVAKPATAGQKLYVSMNSGVSVTTQDLAPQTLAPAGGNLPHDNIMPSLVLNYIICLNGIFPSQS